jgi:hypothetical protein
MADDGTQSTQDLPALEQQETPLPESPWQAQEAADSDPPAEAIVGGAFVGGFVLAKLLKRLGRGGD